MSTTVQTEVGGTDTMTADQAFAEAMKFENRWNPYPFFDELRKTPVARVANGVYAVTGYKELIALIHDPDELFTEDVSYRQSPYEEPVVGLDAVGRMWDAERDGPDEGFTLPTDLLAVDGATAVIRARTTSALVRSPTSRR